ncbi:hypothetical protein MS3_00000005 [Schistosoma haematobium]|uniref:Uncharacterized protein n=1 Tax=Schistosoma haematobium TaxID=6185 RepID=A0A922IT55_SCHHA|nr:hypothetical protein MS3_00000005 [Schistosoma haematobium]KAH9586794.1 hypothetical protein MS3_00000005 [Schistosoma haematobium]
MIFLIGCFESSNHTERSELKKSLYKPEKPFQYHSTLLNKKKMKFTLPSCLLVIVFTKLFDCQNTCGRIKDVKYEKIISQNTTYSYSDHYEYFQRIHLDQPNPIQSGTFVKSKISSEMVKPKFQFKYYGKIVNGLTMIDSGLMETFGDKLMGQIKIFEKISFGDTPEILNETELFAVKWSLQENTNSGDETGQVTYLIYPNGKMSIYFENVSFTIEW